ncbi:hypothetical protein C0J52_24107 [Blattella germanica]|nr:hypothetical protein C0J52_24107 [Blattella germanica]
MLLLVGLFLTILLGVPASPCHIYLNIADCSNQDILNLPVPLNKNTTTLIASRNRFNAVVYGSLQWTLIHIDLSYNRIKFITPDAFANLTNLESVNLEGSCVNQNGWNENWDEVMPELNCDEKEKYTGTVVPTISEEKSTSEILIGILTSVAVMLVVVSIGIVVYVRHRRNQSMQREEISTINIPNYIEVLPTYEEVGKYNMVVNQFYNNYEFHKYEYIELDKGSDVVFSNTPPPLPRRTFIPNNTNHFKNDEF